MATDGETEVEQAKKQSADNVINSLLQALVEIDRSIETDPMMTIGILEHLIEACGKMIEKVRKDHGI